MSDTFNRIRNSERDEVLRSKVIFWYFGLILWCTSEETRTQAHMLVEVSACTHTYTHTLSHAQALVLVEIEASLGEKELEDLAR